MASSVPLDVPAEQRDLVVAIARCTLERTAPQELPLLELTASEYFEDPRAVLQPGGRDEPLGFGLDVSVVTPQVLALAAAAAQFLLSTASSAAGEALGPRIQSLVRRLLRAEPEPAPAIDPELADRLHAVTLERAAALGMAPPQATVLADSIVGALTVSR